MSEDEVSHDDLVNRVAVGRMARELLDDFLKNGKLERPMGVIQLCERMGVTIPNRQPLKIVRDGQE